MERVRSNSILEYLTHLRFNEEFVSGPDEDDYFDSGRNGLFVTQDLNQILLKIL